MRCSPLALICGPTQAQKLPNQASWKAEGERSVENADWRMRVRMVVGRKRRVRDMKSQGSMTWRKISLRVAKRAMMTGLVQLGKKL